MTNKSINNENKDSYRSKSSGNRLRSESSPYLQMHAGNPVDWFPWSEEAFMQAKTLDRPVFLSIGYSTCHWCHVMERESFENPQVAEVLNERFICIKVDREERPDLDEVYMTVCQMMTGGGGWPLTVLMTPDKKPFFAATYLPAVSRHGRLGLMDLAARIEDLWQNHRDKVYQSVEGIYERLQMVNRLNEPSQSEPGPEQIEQAYQDLAHRFDKAYGGFGSAPKFPSAHNLTFLLRQWKRSGNIQPLNMGELTLRNMRAGGIYDHIGFGFHRYATDAKWRLPHFEKMLYDQAMLTLAYLEAWQATGRQCYLNTVKEIIEYVRRDMTGREGGFYSAEDADSDGYEGAYYLWSVKSIRDILAPDETEWMIDKFHLETSGNYEDEASRKKTGLNILYLDRIDDPAQAWSEEDNRIWSGIRKVLLERRNQRPHPFKDDKILTDWNGLMIAALARAGRSLDDPGSIAMAEQATQFVIEKMIDSDCRLWRRFRQGEAEINGFLEDYAFLIWGLIELYQTVFDAQYLERALCLSRFVIRQFGDKRNGGFYHTGAMAEKLIIRSKNAYDNAIPSGNSIMAMNLARLGRLTGDLKLEALAWETVRAFGSQILPHPNGFMQMLQTVDYLNGPSCEIVVAGPYQAHDTLALLKVINQGYRPDQVILQVPGRKNDAIPIADLVPALKDYHPVDTKATAWVCSNYKCNQPVTEPGRLGEML